MKKLDHWICGLLDYWIADARGGFFQKSMPPSIQQSVRCVIRHSSLVI
jgi:hypothetical protein